MTKKRYIQSYLSRIEQRVVLPVILFAMLVAPSCKGKSGTTPQGGPVVERTSVHYMVPSVNRAHEAVVFAEEMLSNDPPDIDAARKSLGKARLSLANLEFFYVPATEAREDVYNAYMEYLAERPEESGGYLDSAKHELLQIAERSGSGVEPYVKDLVDRIETVQLHMREDTPVREEFRSLCAVFQLHLLKAQLVLDENAFGEQE